MSTYLRYAGIAASAVLIVFGVASIVIGAGGRNTVRDNLAAEAIVGSPDMTPAGIAPAIAGLKNVAAPTCSVAGKPIASGADARCFAQYMRIHTLAATHGQVYSEMGRFLDDAGTPTNDERAAAINPQTKRPTENAARAIWTSETAFSTALNTSFFAENVALFAIVMGAALPLTGIGFLVVALSLPRPPATRRQQLAAATPAGTTALAR